MIITKPRDWDRIKANLESVEASRVFVMGCGQCATVAGTGGEKEVAETVERLRSEGYEVTGSLVGEVVCHAGSTKLDSRKMAEEIKGADAVLTLACGAGTQTMADSVVIPVFPGLESAFLGNVVRHGVFEERCQMCGECVLDVTAGICPITTCPKGLLNGPCGGMWDGMCEVLSDRECTFVRINKRLESQGRKQGKRILPPKDWSRKLKPGSVNLRATKGSTPTPSTSSRGSVGAKAGEGAE